MKKLLPFLFAVFISCHKDSPTQPQQQNSSDTVHIVVEFACKPLPYINDTDYLMYSWFCFPISGGNTIKQSPFNALNKTIYINVPITGDSELFSMQAGQQPYGDTMTTKITVDGKLKFYGTLINVYPQYINFNVR